jgi:hypothetical protein
MSFSPLIVLGPKKLAGMESFYFRKRIWQVQKKQHIIMKPPLQFRRRTPGFSVASPLSSTPPTLNLGYRGRSAQGLAALFPSKFSCPATHLSRTPWQGLRKQASFKKRGRKRVGEPCSRAGMGLLDAERASPKPALGAREPVPLPSSPGRRQRVLVTILACQSNFILSFLSGACSPHDALCSDAKAAGSAARVAVPIPVSVPIRVPSPPRTDTRRAAPPPPVRATRATKGAQQESERARSRLLPTPLRDVRLSCLCLRAHSPFLKSHG